MQNGLSDKEVAERIKKYGYNELSSSQQKNILHIALDTIKEPMFLLLISCGLLYILLGDYTEGIILLSSIFVIIFISFYQSQKTEKALEALKNLASPRALVIRNGKETRIAGKEVVPDDIMLLNEGDRIAADAILITCNNLNVDESLLTGESFSVSKHPSSENKEINHVYSGTLVTQGYGIAKVINTGNQTRFGELGVTLASIEKVQTPLQRELTKLIKNLFIIGVLLSIGVTVAYYFTRGNFIASLLSGLSAAMAILPEEFQVVLTVFLALGAWRLSKQNVLTRNPAAIETLGSATVLCSDKTGTITQNKMEITALYNENNYFDKIDFIPKKDEIKNTLKAALLASRIDTIDPMEKAIKELFQKTENTLPIAYEFEKEFPLSRSLMCMSRIYKNETRIEAFSKGAPEAVFSLCNLSDQEKDQLYSNIEILTSKGLRVLAVASSSNISENIDDQKDISYTYLGLLAFEDPIREEVPNAIKECHNAGIKVIMITGDYPNTARTIGSQIGIDEHEGIITGAELNELNDSELQERIRSTSIFARVVPEQKLRIVQALQANGEIVAMTGDGVNDAPALKAADIGISMGKKGTDVAREASSLVLLDDNFSSIVAAIRSGRRIYDNLEKAMSYIMAIHIPIIGLTLTPAFLNYMPILLMPLHIVFMELIIDPVSSVVFEAERSEHHIMKRPPRDPNKQFFGSKEILFSLLNGILLLSMVLVVYSITRNEGHTDKEVRAIMFSSLIIGNIMLTLSKLSNTRSFIAVITEMNWSFVIISNTALLILLAVISVPALVKVFSFEFPGFHHFLPSIIGAICLLTILELIKVIRIKLKL